GRAGLGKPLLVAEQSGDLRGDARTVELRVGHDYPTTGVDNRTGVKLLLPVAVRQRDVDAGQADGGHLGDGHRACAAQYCVGCGEREVHAVDVRHRLVAGCGVEGGCSDLVLLTEGVEDAHARLVEGIGSVDDPAVDAGCTLGTTGDQQDRPFGV